MGCTLMRDGQAFNMILSVVTLHRKASKKGDDHFIGSAKECDPAGSAACLADVIATLQLDPHFVTHDNDSSAMKRMREKKRDLALSEAMKGKIVPTLEESLCTRHGGKHVAEDIKCTAEKALKDLKNTAKPKPLKKHATKSETEAHAEATMEYEEAKVAYEEAETELSVLAAPKAQNYMKKSWKACLKEANCDKEKLRDLILNIRVHLYGECKGSCFWHGENYEYSFGPFNTVVRWIGLVFGFSLPGSSKCH